MSDELAELLDIAIYKEMTSQAVYITGQSQTQNPDTEALMKKLAVQKVEHKKRYNFYIQKSLFLKLAADKACGRYQRNHSLPMLFNRPHQGGIKYYSAR